METAKMFLAVGESEAGTLELLAYALQVDLGAL